MSHQGPAVSLLAALAITLATAGSMGHVGSIIATQASLTGASATVVQGMTAATLTSLCVSTGNSLLNNTHNPTKAFQDFLSDKTLLGALKAGSIGGATAGLGHVFGVPQDAATLGDRALKGVVNTVATTGVHGVFGDSPEDALKAELRTGVVAVVQGTLAHKIGDAKQESGVGSQESVRTAPIGTATGLALHGLAGGLGGVILAGKDGILPGAVGAMVGEGVAELASTESAFNPTPDSRFLTPGSAATLGKFIGALSGAAVDMAHGGDGTKGLAVATLTASTAVEENYERHQKPDSRLLIPDSCEEPPLTPRSKARKLAEDYAEGLVDKTGLEDETLRAMYGTAVGADSMGQYAYDQMEQEIAVKAALKQNRGETLSPYETGVLHDYRIKEGMPLAIAVGFGVAGRVMSAAAKPFYQAYQVVKRAMGRGSVEKTFQSKFWNRHETHTFLGQTNKVYKRDDLIDLGRVDPKGRTSLELMQRGQAPVGPDKLPINLHHMTQTQGGPIAEVTATMHSKHHRILHIWTNQSKGGVSRAESLPGIDRAAFERWKSEYWIARAAELKGAK